MRLLFLLFLFILTSSANAQYKTRFETSGGKQTPTYEEGIEFYKLLAKDFPQIQITEKGLTDSGKPLHLVLYSKNKTFDIKKLKSQQKAVFLINNAIHPGEPDGVDASMMLLRDIAVNPEKFPELDNLVLAIIPFYNIGGTLNRNSTTRTNQEGPEEYGFRGNARNYDLNRDFIKSDTKNARSFAAIFHELDPDLFADTHVSNGADYQYVITLDYAQKDKLGGKLGFFNDKVFLPYMYKHLKESGFEATPYVNSWGQTPDKGFVQFPDWPRYSTGYAALFHTIGVMTETHMLKPYDKRVASTYAYLLGNVKFLARNRKELLKLRKDTKEAVKKQEKFAVTWEVNKVKNTQIEFKGFESEYITSKVSGVQRLSYNRSKPFTKKIPFYDTYMSVDEVTKPVAYIIPQGWHNVIDLMKLNGVEVTQLEKDTEMEVETYYIEDLETPKLPFEGHYWHTSVKTKTVNQRVTFKKGDWYIPVNQWTNRYIVETLEPKGVDSFFKWNFFDTILQSKEHYSAYVFEDLAAELLAKDVSLRIKLADKRKSDPEFAKSSSAQLDFIYDNSPYREKEYMRYPVFRLMK
ncbi:M14 family metallopeptidase [Dyadobacter chenwenxiniae]|uniref:M14 family metallopeptidase n=1 Tax=Dyadobacter chenwenxiniae TaxID=2906456 RepID=A0A9X1PIM6_9BACT|nr:M14 family metallopeptidase [Dyadobacter chenwenxiniae]MCF0060799.1 M14 family metallopeptidase [Dyadobacter chenwenxiniae]UON80631.1 M14 family metallopeptidase [Dyadobacter chenwenxiniae]